MTAFFTRVGRDLPWRRPDAGPWAVLVSEVMLQQTPVVRVLPVYQEWMRRWPSPAALAGAPTADLLRVWGRLGYPRRALRLQRAAAAILADHDGRVPGTVPQLLALPGVGEYTARAVAAFAFGTRVPVVDTNVRRVLSRAVRGIDEHGPATAADRAQMETLLPDDAAMAVTVSAAVMEVGALVCTVRSPRCGDCPLAETCAWRAAGYPPGPPRRRPVQAWHGTDRQLRGRIMAVLRAADGPLAEQDVADTASPPSLTATAAGADQGAGTAAAQWRRCVDSLVADGLAVRDPRGRLHLP